VPAAAVIPALRVYMNVVAVKKPVVGFEDLDRVFGSKAFGLRTPKRRNMSRF
jgi:hypothetical protein